MARLRNKRALERRLEALEAQVGSRWSAGTKVPYKVYQEAQALMVAHMGACVEAPAGGRAGARATGRLPARAADRGEPVEPVESFGSGAVARRTQ